MQIYRKVIARNSRFLSQEKQTNRQTNKEKTKFSQTVIYQLLLIVGGLISISQHLMVEEVIYFTLL